MKRSYLALLVALLFVPVGWRIAHWPKAEVATLDAAEVAAGKELFTHVWQANDPMCKGGDGVGPIFNAQSCVACHFQGGVGGGGGLTENVTTYQAFNLNCGVPISASATGVLHTGSTTPNFLETADLVDGAMPKTSKPTLELLKQFQGDGRGRGLQAAFSQRNTPALFGAKLIDEIPDRVIIAEARKQDVLSGMAGAKNTEKPVGRVLFNRDGKAGKFGWKGQTVSLLAFVQGACANELGLSNPNNPQPKSLAQPNYNPPQGFDLTVEQCQQMATFIASLPAPKQVLPADAAEQAKVHEGKAIFTSMGCAVCHVPNLGSVEGIYSDLLVHRMGSDLQAAGNYFPSPGDDPENAPLADEWRTPPLWGVADSAPYLHDGRAATLFDAIKMHTGQGARAARDFERATAEQREQLLSFLKSLKAPQP